MCADVIHREDIRVVEGAGGPRFLLEAAQAVGVVRHLPGQDFDGDVAVQAGIASPIYLAHAPVAKYANSSYAPSRSPEPCASRLVLERCRVHPPGRKNGTSNGLAGILAIGGLAAFAGAQLPDFSKSQITTEKIADNLYVLFGDGGNIGLSVGPDGAFLIDDQYVPLTAKVARRDQGSEPAAGSAMCVNTHWHDDHSGGNENLAKPAR